MKRPYELMRLLNRGGYGEVWLVRDANGRVFALKKLLDRSPTFFESLKDEVMKLLRLRGTPGVIEMVDFDLDGPEPFVVMELADGSLLDLIHGPMDPAIAIGIVQHIVEVVDATHKKGVLHRDIKPANILLKNGNVRLADFGLGKGAETLLLTVGGVGTPGYMAPEQRRFGPVFSPADVYGLGATLFHMLTGRTPPKDRSGLDPRWVVGACPATLAALVMAMTAEVPEHRPTLHEVARQLGVILQYLPPVHVPAPARPRRTSGLGDVIGALAIGAGIGLGIVGLASALGGGGRRRR